MEGLDTSVVLRLLVGEPADQAEIAWQWLTEGRASRGPVAAVSDLVVGETYFALRHHYGVPHSRAVTGLRQLLDDQRIVATGAARAVLREAGDGTSPGVMDRLIHADYQRGSATVLTFDRSAARLPGAKLLTS